jgi:hypothetical protein
MKIAEEGGKMSKKSCRNCKKKSKTGWNNFYLPCRECFGVNDYYCKDMRRDGNCHSCGNELALQGYDIIFEYDGRDDVECWICGEWEHEDS